MHKPMEVLIAVMEAGCLRVSEVLQIRGRDVSGSARVVVVGRKRSRPIVFRCVDLRDYILQTRTQPDQLVFPLTRLYVYRYFKAHGLFMKLPGRKRNAVTHSIRHRAAIDVRNLGKDDSFVTSALHHRSSTTASHYGQ